VTDSSPAGAALSRQSLLALSVLLGAAVLKATVSFDPFPGWGGDPTSVAAPILGLTPILSIALDAVTFIAAAAALLAPHNRTPPAWMILCFAVGSAAAIAHARFIDGGSLDNLVLSSSWISALAAGLAVSTTCREATARRMTVAAVLGLIVALSAKGAAQVLIEHPRTVQWFMDNREQILTSQGWSLDSTMARNYERRLLQSEASGWFGLSNVYATFAAGCSVALIGLTAVASRRRDYPHRRFVIAALAAGALCALTALTLAGSKGGFAAGTLGLALLALTWLLTKPRLRRLGPRFATLLGPTVVAAALLAVVARGLIGERIGELSILFRWFYMQGAARIFANNWMLGVGPAAFKDAYMLAKPAISPEDVSSPHSIFLDWAATLGVGGLAWGMLLLTLVWAAGRNLAPSAPTTQPEQPSVPDLRTELRTITLTLVIPMLFAAWLERPAATLDSTLVRLFGMVGGGVIASAVLILLRSPSQREGPRVGSSSPPSKQHANNPANSPSPSVFPITAVISAAALAMAAHCQIELTATTPAALPWLFIFIGVAAAGLPHHALVTQHPRRLTLTITGLFTVLALSLWSALPATARWEFALRQAAATVRELPDLAARQSTLAAQRWKPTQDGDSLERLSADLSRLLAIPVPAAPEPIQRAFIELQVRQAALAAGHLQQALNHAPTHSATAHALSSLWLDSAFRAAALGRIKDAIALADKSEQYARQAIAAASQHPSEYGWLGNVLRAQSQLQSDPNKLMQATQAWEQAAQSAPHELLFPLQLVDAYQQLNQSQRAAKWASQALIIDTQLRLDPLKQLSQAEKDRLSRVVEASARRPFGTPPPP